ncbi:hypothetical protein [Nitrosococcus wardiae]|uniref:Uncharacterized protein n=1 Tax=Nitrosococcus wardiae TaxID=1814290 RepID=A0A4P7BYT9_9GAMM|nr:hypothetical protein [Nitrosococcus wardiae]QBQ54419.1 hypothetical protein E3U44_07785 [Nitrosococcus wardiae]
MRTSSPLYLQIKFPQIQRLAGKLGAEIGFEDEAGVKPQTRSRRTWGLIGQPLVPRAVKHMIGYFDALSLPRLDPRVNI